MTTPIKNFKDIESLQAYFDQLNAKVAKLTDDNQKLTTKLVETQVELHQVKESSEKLEKSNQQLILNNQQMLIELNSNNVQKQQYIDAIDEMKNKLLSFEKSLVDSDTKHKHTINQYNQLVKKYNQLFEEYNGLLATNKKQLQLLNEFKRYVEIHQSQTSNPFSLFSYPSIHSLRG